MWQHCCSYGKLVICLGEALLIYILDSSTVEVGRFCIWSVFLSLWNWDFFLFAMAHFPWKKILGAEWDLEERPRNPRNGKADPRVTRCVCEKKSPKMWPSTAINFTVEKSSPKIWVGLQLSKKLTFQSKDSPDVRKFDQSGHPGWTQKIVWKVKYSKSSFKSYRPQVLLWSTKS
jgi:hypothetical protein